MQMKMMATTMTTSLKSMLMTTTMKIMIHLNLG